MRKLFWKIIDRLDKRFNKLAASAHNYKPGSEKMVESETVGLGGWCPPTPRRRGPRSQPATLAQRPS